MPLKEEKRIFKIKYFLKIRNVSATEFFLFSLFVTLKKYNLICDKFQNPDILENMKKKLKAREKFGNISKYHEEIVKMSVK